MLQLGLTCGERLVLFYLLDAFLQLRYGLFSNYVTIKQFIIRKAAEIDLPFEI